MIMVYILFIIGLVLIIKGGDWFVDSAVWIAEATGIPSIIIGATIVSVATTLPELIVSVQANLQGLSEMAIGNAIGSIICNIGLIASLGFIGLSNSIDRKLFIKKSVIMIAALSTFAILAWDLKFSHLEAFIVSLFIILFLYYNIRGSKTVEKKYEKLSIEIDKSHVIKNGVLFIGGALSIVIGAKLLVDNGQVIAVSLGVPEAIISLTMIALGTSLPELTTMLTAIRKKNQAIGLGNIIGANILNVALILTASSAISKDGLPIQLYDFNLFGKALIQFPSTLKIDIPFALLLMFLFSLPTCIYGKTKKWQGYSMLGVYLFFLGLRVTTGIS